MTLYLTTMLGAPISAESGEVLGDLDDLLADARQWPAPRMMRVAVRFHGRDRGWLHVEAVRRFGPGGIEIEPRASWGPPDRTHLLRLRGQLLDHQVIDLVGAAVMRVNDVILATTPDGFVVTGVDVGLTGLARELAPRPSRGLLGRIQPRSSWQRELAWVDIDPVESAIDHYQLFDAHAGIRRLAPAAIAQVLRPLRRGDRMAILGALSGETVAAVLAASDPRFCRLLMTHFNQ